MAGKGRPLDTTKVNLLVEEVRSANGVGGGIGGNEVLKKAYLHYTPMQIKSAKAILDQQAKEKGETAEENTDTAMPDDVES